MARKIKSTSSKIERIPLAERVIHRFFLISKRFDQAFAVMHAKKLGISVNHWKIVRVVAFHAPLSATELGCRTSLDPDKITRAIDTLVDRGYVIRKNDEADRRRVVLTLSAKGRRIHDKIDMAVGAMEAEFLSALSTDERKALVSFLDKLERDTSLMFGHQDEFYERRHLAGEASRRIKPDAVRPAKQARRTVARKLVVAK